MTRTLGKVRTDIEDLIASLPDYDGFSFRRFIQINHEVALCHGQLLSFSSLWEVVIIKRSLDSVLMRLICPPNTTAPKALGLDEKNFSPEGIAFWISAPGIKPYNITLGVQLSGFECRC